MSSWPYMDVDADNFEEALREFELHLPQSAFVSLDLEMTGITGPPHTKVSGGDIPQVQYAKGCAVVSQPYNIVQIGICLFHEKSPGHFDCRPFNIFLFPRPFEERDPEGKPVKVDDHYIGLSASSTLFLADHGLDFNRWVRKGVNYTTAATEALLRKALPTEQQSSSQHQANANSFNGREKVEANRPEDVALVKDTLKKVSDFAARGDEEMKLPSTNAFLALVLRQKIAEKHPGLVIEKRPSGANPHFQERWLMNLSEEGRKERDAATRRRILGHIGFRRMWTSLKTQRRPVVFHNGFFDLLFLFRTLEGGLPSALPDFKRKVHEAFPVLLDTKVLAEAPELSGCLSSRSSLPELSAGLEAQLRNASSSEVGETVALATLTKTIVSFSFSDGFGAYSAGEARGGGGGGEDTHTGASFHTAGYDAYETGRIFAYFRAKLGDPKTCEFLNRVHLMFSAFDLCLAEPTDRLLYHGVARYLHDVDTAALNSRGLAELLKPVIEEGKRRAVFKWCSDYRSLILVICRASGSGQASEDAADREACAMCLDGLLRPQEEQKRLKFKPLAEHIQSMEVAALAELETAATGEAPDSKRRRYQR